MTKKLTTMKKDYLREPYTRIVIPDVDGGYVAEIMEFDGCFADGRTASEALKNLEKTARAWIHERLESNLPMPEPTGQFANEMSGRFALRLPKHLHYKAALFAEREGVSLNTFIVDAISGSVGILDFIDRYARRRMDNVIFNVILQVGGTYNNQPGSPIPAKEIFKTAQTLQLPAQVSERV